MKKLAVLIVIFVLLLSLIPTGSVAFADTRVYSDVLDDLQADENFNLDDYPVNQTDFSLTLMQLAEGNDNSLLAYVYQPSAGRFDMLAKKIRMRIGESSDVFDYNLTLLSRNGVFYKYKVENYIADYSSSVRRIYNVIALFRKASVDYGDTLIDEHNNTVDYVSYPVGWTFTAVNNENEIYYGKDKLDIIEVTDKYCGQLKFENDYFSDFLYSLCGVVYNYSMLHFIAFNTDKPIDTLQVADISYTLNTQYKTVMYSLYGTDVQEETSSSYVPLLSLSASESETFQGGIFGHQYTWHQIMSKYDFVNNVVSNSSAFFDSGLTESGASDLDGKRWVLCFLLTEIETTTSSSNGITINTFNTSYVTDETILRLQFLTDGKPYNLGVVDNYQHGDGVQDNYEKYGFNEEWWNNFWEELQEWLKIILIILGVIVLCVLLYFLYPVLKVISKIILAPFKWIFGRSSKKQKYKGKKRG